MRRLVLIPAIAVLLVTLGACGAKEEPTATSSGAPASKSSSDATTTSTTEREPSTDGGTDATTDSGSGDGGQVDQIEDLESIIGTGECAQVATLYAEVMQQSIILMSPDTSAADLEQIQTDIDNARADVPAEIDEAFDVWSEAYSEFVVGMGTLTDNGGLTNPANFEEFSKLSEKLDSAEVKEASTKIETYIDEKCKAGS